MRTRSQKSILSLLLSLFLLVSQNVSVFAEEGNEAETEEETILEVTGESNESETGEATVEEMTEVIETVSEEAEETEHSEEPVPELQEAVISETEQSDTVVFEEEQGSVTEEIPEIEEPVSEETVTEPEETTVPEYTEQPAEAAASEEEQNTGKTNDLSSENIASLDEEMLSLSAENSISVSTEFSYKENEDGTITITGYSGSDSIITLPSEIDGKTVTGLAGFSFYNNTYLKEITISDNVTVIEEETFSNCTRLTNITIPASVTSIASNAFSKCSSLSEISVSSDNPVYDSRNNCNAIIETATNTLIVGGNNTVIPEDVSVIGTDAFAWRRGLTTIELPGGLKKLDSGAFRYCEDLETITLPDSLATIEDSVFDYCVKMSSISVPENVSYIGGIFVAGCSNLAEISVDPDNQTYDSRDNCNAIIETATNTLKIGCKTTVIPTGVTVIDSGALQYCKGFTNITIPEGVTEIGNWAFGECTDLESVTLPASISLIKYGAFGECGSLKDIYYAGTAEQWSKVTIEGRNDDLLYAVHHFDELDDLKFTYEEKDDGTVTITGYSGNAEVIELPAEIDGKTVTGLAGYSFYGNTHLKEITISEHVTAIEDETFYGCTGLASVTIPASVTSIASNAFSKCSSLSEISVSSDNPVYDSRNNCNAIIETATNTLIVGGKDTVIPDDITAIGNSAFAWRSGLRNVNLPEGLKIINYGAFSNCEDLETITLPNSLETIEDRVFYNCTSLTSIGIPENVSYIGGDLVLGCSNLTELYVEPDNQTYDSRGYCNAIIETATNTLKMGCKTTVIPSGVIIIDGAAFYQCKGLTSMTVPEGVTEIKNWAFRECADLESVILPESISTIYFGAFGECGSLKDVYYAGTAEQWSAVTFEGDNAALLGASIHYESNAGLSAPENVTIDENGIITWDPVEGVDDYYIKLYRLDGRGEGAVEFINDSEYNIYDLKTVRLGISKGFVVIPSVGVRKNGNIDWDATSAGKAYSMNDYYTGIIESGYYPTSLSWETDRNCVAANIEAGKWYAFELLKDNTVIYSETKQTDSEYTDIIHPAFSDAGEYTFTLRIGDTQQDAESSIQVINSNVYRHNLAPDQLSAPSDLRWEGNTVTWDSVELADYYRIAFINSETNLGEYSELISSTGSSRETYPIPDGVVQDGSHAWVFSVEANSADSLNVNSSEVSYSEAKLFADRMFTTDHQWLEIDDINMESDPIPFEYTVNGAAGDPSELTFTSNYEEMSVILNDDNTLTLLASKEGNYEVYIKYIDELLLTLHVEVGWRTYHRFAYLVGDENAMRAGNEYSFTVIYRTSSSGFPDYSDLSFTLNEEAINEGIAEITPTQNNGELTVKALKEGIIEIKIFSDKYAGPLDTARYEIRPAAPDKGVYLEFDLADGTVFNDLDRTIYTYAYYFVDGAEEDYRKLTYTITNPAVIELESMDRWQNNQLCSIHFLMARQISLSVMRQKR